VRLFLLKAVATAFTLGATALSAAYVTTHLKNPAAPLQPSVLNPSTTALGGTVAIGPSVQPTNQAPITSTYAS
jgi:hypothetical protein